MHITKASIACLGFLLCGCAHEPTETEVASSQLTAHFDSYVQKHIHRLSLAAQENAAQKTRCDELFKNLRIGMTEASVRNHDPKGKCASIHSTITAHSKRVSWQWTDGSGRTAVFDNGKLVSIQD
jgi:hypothetical protein